MKIGKVNLVDLKYLDLSDATRALIKSTVILENVDITYELNCELEDYKGIATQVFHFNGLEFSVEITKNHATGSVDPLIKFENIFGGILKLAIKNFPSNPHTQIIAREV